MRQALKSGQRAGQVRRQFMDQLQGREGCSQILAIVRAGQRGAFGHGDITQPELAIRHMDALSAIEPVRVRPMSKSLTQIRVRRIGQQAVTRR